MKLFLCRGLTGLRLLILEKRRLTEVECEEWHRISRNKFLLSSGIKSMGTVKVKKDQPPSKRWQLVSQFAMDL